MYLRYQNILYTTHTWNDSFILIKLHFTTYPTTDTFDNRFTKQNIGNII